MCLASFVSWHAQNDVEVFLTGFNSQFRAGLLFRYGTAILVDLTGLLPERCNQPIRASG
jgi:hypothetical protein